MQDEIYDVVDAKGNKIGTATWTECHTKGLRHQTVSALIFRDDSRQETLLQKRSAEMVQSPGLWQHAAAGHILSGDTPDEAIRKEIKEEIFARKPFPPLTITKITQFFNHDFPDNYEILHLYEVIYPGPFFPEHKEVAELKWVPWEKVVRDIEVNPENYASYFITIVSKYLAAKKTVNAL